MHFFYNIQCIQYMASFHTAFHSIFHILFHWGVTYVCIFTYLILSFLINAHHCFLYAWAFEISNLLHIQPYFQYT